METNNAQQPISLAAPNDSPLLRQYGRQIIDGNEWKDATAYAQRGSKTPSCWALRKGSVRLVIYSRGNGDYRVHGFPDLAEWTIQAGDVETAARNAVNIYAATLRALANLVSPVIES